MVFFKIFLVIVNHRPKVRNKLNNHMYQMEMPSKCFQFIGLIIEVIVIVSQGKIMVLYGGYEVLFNVGRSTPRDDG